MFKKEHIENKMDTVEKRSHHAPLTIVPTSIFTGQTLATLTTERIKKIKFSLRSKEIYQLR